MPLNIPNLLTWLRIILIPLFVGIFYFEKSWVSLPNQNLVATVIFTLAAITDWFDGWLARKLNQTSAFGAFLDPVADKLMVAAALIILLLGSSRMDGADRRFRERCGFACRQDQNRLADDCHPAAALRRPHRHFRAKLLG
jgi:hypothetical protein